MLTLNLTLPSEPANSRLLRQEVVLLLSHHGADHGCIERAELIVTEAFANVVRHAYGKGGGECQVSLALGEGKLVIKIEDCGRGFVAHGKYFPPSLGEESGWGMYFIHSTADNLQIESTVGSGTVLTAVVNLG